MAAQPTMLAGGPVAPQTQAQAQTGAITIPPGAGLLVSSDSAALSPALAPGTGVAGVQGGGGLDQATMQMLGLGQYNPALKNGAAGGGPGGSGGCGCGGASQGAAELGSGGSPIEQSPVEQSPVQQEPEKDRPEQSGRTEDRGRQKAKGKRAKILEAARSQLGIREQGGENAGVGKYSRAVLGKELVAPWCAFFVSWVYQQAGVKLGANGKGDGYVPTLTSWAKSAKRFIAPGKQPKPGDLMILERGGRPGHIGVVEKVTADGTVHTIEGNASDMVRRVTYSPSDARILGYIKAV